MILQKIIDRDKYKYLLGINNLLELYLLMHNLIGPSFPYGVALHKNANSLTYLITKYKISLDIAAKSTTINYFNFLLFQIFIY